MKNVRNVINLSVCLSRFHFCQCEQRLTINIIKIHYIITIHSRNIYWTSSIKNLSIQLIIAAITTTILLYSFIGNIKNYWIFTITWLYLIKISITAACTSQGYEGWSYCKDNLLAYYSWKCSGKYSCWIVFSNKLDI